MDQLIKVFDELVKIKTIESVYFEGGEPFLFYPLMVEAIRIARNKGFKVGIVTNAYWATSERDAELWLKPLAELGVSDLSLSDDSFHFEEQGPSPANYALKAAKRLGLPVAVISIDKPTVQYDLNKDQAKGKPVLGGTTMFRGRAVDKLIKGLPTKPWRQLEECPYEDLRDPERVHLDPYGNVHLCQGLIMGNVRETPLSKLVEEYDNSSHPICGPLAEGGPALLSRTYAIKHRSRYVDACHFCYCLRLSLLDRFPKHFAPRQVYGLTSTVASR
jgi:MoaA/NifB/PqqE/SkfB family radical SAM enzyme